MGLCILFVLIGLLGFGHADEQAETPGWEKDRNQSIPHYILPNEHTSIIEPSTLCKKDEPILLLIIIFSKPSNFEQRQSLRETWANGTEFNYSKFSKIHAHLKDQYLQFDDPKWMQFVKKDSKDATIVGAKEETPSNKSSVDYSQLDFHVRTAFLIAQTQDEETQNKIYVESRTYDDVIQEGFVDSYNNLTLKTAMLFKWINRNCRDKVKFAMKADDDSFVNIPNLIHYLLGGTIPFYNVTLNVLKGQNNQNIMDTLDDSSRLTRHEDLLVGSLLCHTKPCTKAHHKSFAPRYMFDGDVYPNFLAGGSGYVFTMDTASKIYNVSMKTPFFVLEDVYFTGICAEKAGIESRNSHFFNNEHFRDMCEFRGLISQHHTELYNLKLAYDFVLNPNAQCAPPERNAAFGLLNDTNEYCSNKYSFGNPKMGCE